MPHGLSKSQNKMKQLIVHRLDLNAQITSYIGEYREIMSCLRNMEYTLYFIGYTKDPQTHIWKGPTGEQLLLETTDYPSLFI